MIKKEIGSNMDNDNNEFFDLLNQTTQSFYNTLNQSVGGDLIGNKTFYQSMKSGSKRIIDQHDSSL